MYFSPLPMLEGESARFSREITASLSKEEDAKSGERMMKKDVRFRGRAGALTLAIQETLPSRAMTLVADLLTTRGRVERRKEEKEAETELPLGEVWVLLVGRMGVGKDGGLALLPGGTGCSLPRGSHTGSGWSCLSQRLQCRLEHVCSPGVPRHPELSSFCCWKHWEAPGASGSSGTSLFSPALLPLVSVPSTQLSACLSWQCDLAQTHRRAGRGLGEHSRAKYLRLGHASPQGPRLCLGRRRLGSGKGCVCSF